MEVSRINYSSISSLNSIIVLVLRSVFPLRIRSRVRFASWGRLILASCLVLFICEICLVDRGLAFDPCVIDVVLDREGDWL